MNLNPYTPPKARVEDLAPPRDDIVRPAPVTWAARSLWAGLALGLVNICLAVRYEIGVQMSAPILVGAAVVFVLTAALTGLMAIKILAGRNWARILLLIINLASLLSVATRMESTFQKSSLLGVLSVLIYALDYLAVVLVFLGRSNVWFKKKNAP